MEDLVNDLMVVVMMIRRTRMRMEISVKTREIILITSMIRTIEIREEEVEEKNLEEENSLGNVFTMEKKGIEHLNVPNTKEW